MYVYRGGGQKTRFFVETLVSQVRPKLTKFSQARGPPPQCAKSPPRRPRQKRGADRPRCSRVVHPGPSGTICAAFRAGWRAWQPRAASPDVQHSRAWRRADRWAKFAPEQGRRLRRRPGPGADSSSSCPKPPRRRPREKKKSDRTPMAWVVHPSHRRPITSLFLARGSVCGDREGSCACTCTGGGAKNRGFLWKRGFPRCAKV